MSNSNNNNCDNLVEDEEISNNKKNNDGNKDSEEEDFVTYPMLRKRRRRKRTCSVVKKNRAQKEEDAQSSLISKILSMLKEAQYELEVDAYRGIFDETSSNTFRQCSQIKRTIPATISDNNEDDDEENDTIYNGIQCPCVKSWINKERQNRNKKKKIQKNSKKNKNTKKQKNDKVDSMVDLREDSDEKINNNNNTVDNQMLFKLTRDDKCQCQCDFNPLCLFSLGGAMDDFLYHTYYHCAMKENKGTQKDLNDPLILGSNSNDDYGDVTDSVSNHPNSNDSSTKSDTFEETCNETDDDYKDTSSQQDQTSCCQSDDETITTTQNISTNTTTNDTSDDELLLSTTTITTNEIKLNPKSFEINNKENVETSGDNSSIGKSHSSNCSATNNKLDAKETKCVIENKTNNNMFLSEKQKEFESIHDAGDVFLKFSRKQIMELMNQMANHSEPETESSDDKIKNNSSDEICDMNVSEVRQSTWVDQKTIEKYLRDLVFQFDPCDSESGRENIQLNIDKCIAIIRSWNNHLIYSVPDFNGELIEHFKKWLPISLSGLETLDPSELIKEKDTQYATKRYIKLAMSPGIGNLGATCYLNSQFQVLAQNPVFSLGVFSWNAKQDDDSEHFNRMNKVLNSMQLILSRMIFGAKNVVSTVEFSNALGLENGEMQDPNEFTRLLFDRIHESFQQSSFSTSSSKFSDLDGINNSLGDLLPRLFQGKCVYETTCLKCENKSVQQENFMDLSLPLSECDKQVDGTNSPVRSSKDPSEVSVQSCLDQYLQPEVLDAENQYHCEQCGTKCIARRNVSFSALPPVLNIQLARYVFDRKQLMKRKVLHHVLLPKVLRVPQRAPSKNSNEINNSKTSTTLEYILCAVQNHRGRSAYGGHYVAEAMDWTTGVWYEYNDEQVTILTDGPNSSYDPDQFDQDMAQINVNTNCAIDDQSNGSNDSCSKSIDKKKNPKGSTDAYNLYYVEKSFLAKCAKKQLLEFHKQVKRLKTPILENESLTTQYNSIFKVTKERLEAHKLMSQVHTERLNSAERLLRRKAGILFFLLPNLMKSTQDVSESVLQSNNNLLCEKESAKDDEQVWVEGSVLRHYLSCSDEMDDIIFGLDSKSEYILSNKKWLCLHGEGLHPRIARTGKLLPRAAYDALISLMSAEMEYIRLSMSSDDQHHKNQTDIMITTNNKLYCSNCVEAYRKSLQEKVTAIQTMLSLYDALNNGSADINLNEISDENGHQQCFAISRNFITSFKKYIQHKFKEVSGMIGQQGNKVKLSCISSSVGIDTLDLSDILPRNINAEGCPRIPKSDSYDRSDQKESLDQFVNSNIICCHGNLITTNKRSMRLISHHVWEKVYSFFPNAKIVPYGKQEMNKNTISCTFCLQEKEHMHELELSLRAWASEIMSDEIADSNLQECNTNIILRNLHLRTTSKSPSDEKMHDSNFCTKIGKEFRLVHHLDVSAWNFVIQTILSTKRSKVCKGSKGGDLVSKLCNFLFNNKQLTAQSDKCVYDIDNTFQETPVTDQSRVVMILDKSDKLRWKMHRLLCQKHKSVIGAPQILKNTSISKHDNRAINGFCSSSVCTSEKISRMREKSTETLWELLNSAEYKAFISSTEKLCEIVETVKEIFPPLKIIDDTDFKCHPRLILTDDFEDTTEPSSIDQNPSTSFFVQKKSELFSLKCEPQLCIEKECNAAYQNETSLHCCKILSSILSPVIEKQEKSDDVITVSSDKSVSEHQSHLDEIHLRVHEFDDQVSLSQMCDHVSENLFPRQQRLNGSGIRRSQRKRRRTSIEMNAIELSFHKQGNLAKLRLMIAERSQHIGLVRQQLFILVRNSAIYLKTDVSLDSEGKPEDKEENLKRHESQTYGTALYELPQSWNGRKMGEIFEALEKTKNGNRCVSIGEDIHLILYPIEIKLLIDNGEETHQRPNKSTTEHLEKMEEYIFESVMETANLSQSPKSMDGNNNLVPNFPAKNKQKKEKGFMGTFLQSKIPNKDTECPQKPLLSDSRDNQEDVILIDDDAMDSDTAINVDKLEQNKIFSFELDPDETTPKNVVVDISSDTPSDQSDITSPRELNANSSCNEIHTQGNTPLRNVSEGKDSSFETQCNDNLHCNNESLSTPQPYYYYPISCYDMSSRALDYTSPRNCTVYKTGNTNEIPNLISESSKLVSLNRRQTLKFIQNSRDSFYTPLKLLYPQTSPKMDNLVDLLPDHARNTNHARHLYRNFSDCVDTLLENERASTTADDSPSSFDLKLSRREMDIFLYCIQNQQSYDVCHMLMPYREILGVQKLYDHILCLEYHTKYSTYMEHVANCVGTVVELERYDLKVKRIHDSLSKKRWVFINELVDELSEAITTFDVPRKITIRPFLTIKVCDALKKSSSAEGDWKMNQKQEFLDMILANLLNEK